LAILAGGIYLCVRRAASWEIPVGTLLAGFACAAAAHSLGLTPFSALRHLISGAMLFGAFFIATDPVTSPLTRKGKFLFGLGVGTLVMLIRLFSGYPEGVMFAVLMMNAAVPLVNRWTIPRPLGGPVPEKT
jgi:electron transport complex protein RnfD